MIGKAAVIRAPAKLDTTAIENDIGDIQLRLEVFEDILDMYAENANDPKTEAFYKLVRANLPACATVLMM